MKNLQHFTLWQFMPLVNGVSLNGNSILRYPDGSCPTKYYRLLKKLFNLN